MFMVPVASSNLAAVGYEPMTAELRVAFLNGGLYSYSRVPSALYAGLVNADSHGEYFHDYIRDRYPYRRIL
jgi:hypothetical protein